MACSLHPSTPPLRTQWTATSTRNTRYPKTRRDFWIPKLNANKKRDASNRKKLKLLGYEILVVWECEVRDSPALTDRVIDFLEEER